MTPQEITSCGSFQLDGRTVYTCQGVEGLNPRTLIGQTIRLDGHLVVVRRVETYAVIDPTGQSFSLIVDVLP